MFEIVEDDLSGEQTRALLVLHVSEMQANSPPESAHALDLAGLRAPGITAWTVRRNGNVAAVGALRDLGAGHGELKSMRTHPDWLRQGAGALLLDHVIAVARARGWTRLSLETGAGPAFEPALALYRKRGFVDGEAFGSYERSSFNQFLHRRL